MERPLFKQLEVTIKQGSRRAISRAGKAATRAVQNLIMKRFNIKLGDLNDKKRIFGRLKNDFTYSILMPAVPLPAALFKPVQTSGGSTRKMSVSGVGKNRSIKKSGVQKRNQDGNDRTTIEFIRGRREDVLSPGGMKPFIARMASGHIGVFYRISAKRLKIQEYGMGSVAGLMTSTVALPEMEKTFYERFEAELARFLKESGNA